LIVFDDVLMATIFILMHSVHYWNKQLSFIIWASNSRPSQADRDGINSKSCERLNSYLQFSSVNYSPPKQNSKNSLYFTSWTAFWQL